MMNKPS